jgi:hypothetical protein
MSLELNNVSGIPPPVNTFYVSLRVPRGLRPYLSRSLGETEPALSAAEGAGILTFDSDP